MTDAPAVLFVSHSAQLYGAERSLLALAAALRDRGAFRPFVLVPRRGPLLDALAARDVPAKLVHYHHWIGRRHRALRAPTSMALNLAAAAKLRPETVGKPDLIYTNTVATPFGALLARRWAVPHVWHLRELVAQDTFDFGERRSAKLIARAARVLCNSRAVRDRFARSIDPKRMTVVYNGFEFEEPRAASAPADGQVRLVIAGALHEGKGHADALAALAQLAAAGVDARLDVLGDGPEAERVRLRALARDLGVADAVCWHGFVDDPAAHLARATAVLACSPNEAFGRVAVEAMAAGAPVVAAAAAGLCEVVEDGVTGLLYPPGDADALASAVRKLIDDVALRDRLAAAGSASVRARFSLEAHVGAIEDILSSTLA